MTNDMDDSVFELIGEVGFAQLVAAFYRRVAEDMVLRPLYPEQDLQAAEQRLRDFLVFRFGGPPRRRSAPPRRRQEP